MNPLEDIKLAINYYKEKGFGLPNMYIEKPTFDKLLKETGLENKEQVLQEYRKRYPTEQHFNIEIINR